MEELYIGALALTPVIVAIIGAAKRLGLPSAYAPWTNAVLSVVAYGLVVWIKSAPQYQEPVAMALNIIVVFLLAAGEYDIQKYATNKVK